MKIVKFLFIVLLFLSASFFTGCNNNTNSNESGNGEVKITVEAFPTEKGSVEEVMTPSGLTIKADEGTLNKDVKIIITEKDFTDNLNNYFQNGEKLYEIYGKIEDEIFHNTSTVNYVEKPFLIKIPNTVSDAGSSVAEFYIGVRDNDYDYWRYSRINDDNSVDNPQLISNLRASYSAPYFYLNTTRLNYQFALFGLKKDLSGSDIAIVTAAVPYVLPADREVKSGEESPILINAGKYKEDIKVDVDIQGKNISSLKKEDLIVQLQYMTDDVSDLRSLAGPSAIYTQPELYGGAGNKYSHLIAVKDFDIDSNGKLSFKLNTNEVDLNDFPQDFTVTVRTADQKAPAIPFGYSKGVHFNSETGAIPAIPTSLNVSSSKYKFGEAVKLTWEQKDIDDIPVTFDLYLGKNGSEPILFAQSLRALEWLSSTDDEALAAGSYEAKVLARNKRGSSKFSESVYFEIIDSDITLTAPTNLKVSSAKYKFGDAVKLTWEQKDIDDIPVTFDLYLGKNGSEPVLFAQSLRALEWFSATDDGALATGSYEAKVLARNKQECSDFSESVHFEVIDSVLSVPEIAELQPTYGLNEPIQVSWTKVSEDESLNISYNLWFCQNELENEPTITNLSSATYTIQTKYVEPGTYKIMVEATDGKHKVTSSVHEIKIINYDFEAPVISGLKDLYLLNEKISINWQEISDPKEKGIKYNLWLCKDRFTTEPTFTLSQNSIEIDTATMPTGLYLLKVAATNDELTKTSETAVLNLIATLAAEIDGSEYLLFDNYYNNKPEFTITLNGSSFDKALFENAINVSEADSANINKEWLTDFKMKLSFNEPLETNKTYTISMGNVKDNYDFEITPFNEVSFKAFPLTGSGTTDVPYSIEGIVPEIDRIPDSNIVSLIATISVDLSDFYNQFSGCDISDKVQVCSGEDTIFSDIDYVREGNKISIVLKDRLWPALSDLNARIVFSSEINGNNLFFSTNAVNFTTETGLTLTLGDGSQGKPYLVYTPGQLDSLRDHIICIENYLSDLPLLHNLRKNYKQMRDIDLADYIADKYPENGWEPIGNTVENEDYDLLTYGINGEYDGNNHKITNLTQTITESYNSGLFGNFFGSIKGLTISNAVIIIDNDEGCLGAGVLAGTISDNETFAKFLEAQTGSSDGRMSAINPEFVTDCAVENSTLNIKNTTNYAGLLCGKCTSTCLKNVKVSGNLTFENTDFVFAGGLAGDLSAVYILEDCESNCSTNIEGCEFYTYGGFIGNIKLFDNLVDGRTANYLRNISKGSIAVNNSNIYAEYLFGGHIGGFIGYANNDHAFNDSGFEYCSSLVNIEANNLTLHFSEYSYSPSCIAGFIGTSKADEGSPVDMIFREIQLKNCSYQGNITLSQLNSDVPDYWTSFTIGGLVGNPSSIVCMNCSAQGNYTCDFESGSAYVGGFSGTSCYGESCSLTCQLKARVQSPYTLDIGTTCAYSWGIDWELVDPVDNSTILPWD